VPCLRPLGVGMIQPRHAYPLPRESMAPIIIDLLLARLLRDLCCDSLGVYFASDVDKTTLA
jgi:hypothetical protein